MSWDYRVLKREVPNPLTENSEKEYFEIAHVYYDDEDRIDGWSTTAATLVGYSVAELKDDLQRMQRAFAKPVLIVQGNTLVGVPKAQQPYIESNEAIPVLDYNPDYGDERVCECEHVYRRHFDSYEHMRAVGCKYCSCTIFKERRRD